MTDLSEYRLARAVQTGQVGAFPTFWNAQAGKLWSVARAMSASDADALGWMTSFRVELERLSPGLDPSAPLGPQVGVALCRHLEASFVDRSPLPAGDLPATEESLRRIPDRARLLYLLTLFFDVPEASLADVAGADAPGLIRAVMARLEPVADTDAHLATHLSLLRTPPAGALFLPPGSEPAPKPSRLGWWAAGVALLLAFIVSPVGRDLYHRTSWGDLEAMHTQTLTGPGLVLEGDPAALAGRLAGEGVPSGLAVVPPLTDAGLTLVGARVVEGIPPGVVFVYSSPDALWTLQHHDLGLPSGGTVLATRTTPDGELQAVEGKEGPSVAWADGRTLWVLSAAVPPDTLLAYAERIRAARPPPSIPWPGLN